ncbi:MAG: TIGR00730 family Rossman fold protein [Xanthomonadaceae bacterium]|nr:TIGR00730 family Rossman fold protein [Xanthomonadaceae bacterium]
MRSICVFCGSRHGRNPVYTEAARELGRLLAERGIRLVYGGGRVGLMGEVADAVLAAGGEVIGVIPSLLIDKEVEHRGLTQLHEVGSMHERKALMEQLSDAFVVLPGGFGTLDEACEILTWAQLGLHRKPLGLVNTAGYYDQLSSFLDHVEQEDFLSSANRRRVLVEATPSAILDRLTAV